MSASDIASTGPSLQQQLDAITANTRALVQPERLARTDEIVTELSDSGIQDRILPAGATAPEFSLSGANGKRIRSADLLALGPVIVKFFRGRWCPYDMTELQAWQQIAASVRSAGALIVAISPQTPRQNAFTAERHNLAFPVLSDPTANLAEAFGLAYTVPEPTRTWYRSMLVNIPFLNGDESWRLPLPGIFVLGSDAKVLFSEAHADHRVRPEPAEVLALLQAQNRPEPRA